MQIICDAKRIPPRTGLKNTRTRREARHWVGRWVTPEINGRSRPALSAYIHLAPQRVRPQPIRRCHGQQDSRLVSPAKVLFGRCMPVACRKKLLRWDGSAGLLVTCGVVLLAGGRIVEPESVLVVCPASDHGWVSEKIPQRLRSFSSLLKGKSGTDDGRRGRCAQEMVVLACGVHQTDCPSDSFSLSGRFCVISEGVTTRLERLLERETCWSPASCDPHGGVCSGRVAKICGAMATRTRHLCLSTNFPVRQQSYGSRSLQKPQVVLMRMWWSGRRRNGGAFLPRAPSLECCVK